MLLVDNNAVMSRRKSSGNSIQISVTPRAKTVVDDLMDETEMPQKAILSRIYEWFSQLPKPAQKSILWPEKTADELEATKLAIEFLDRRRAEVRAAEMAAKSAKAAAKDVESGDQKKGRSGLGGQSPPHTSAG